MQRTAVMDGATTACSAKDAAGILYVLLFFPNYQTYENRAVVSQGHQFSYFQVETRNGLGLPVVQNREPWPECELFTVWRLGSCGNTYP